ncbi:ComEC/Rec2 family competence protein [Mariniluteicoccus endophyticus]
MREQLPAGPDLRLVMASVSAWVAMWLATSGSTTLQGLGLAAGAGALVAGAWRRNLLVVAVGAVVCVCSALGALRAHQVRESPVAGLARVQAVVTIDYRVDGDPRVSSGRFGDAVTLPVTVVALDGRGERWATRTSVVVRASGERLEVLRRQQVGSIWRASVRLSATEPGDHRAAFATLVGAPQALAAPPWPLRAAEHVRSGLRAAMEGSADEPRALVPSLVVGDTSAMSDELRQDFMVTGLSHLTAVSGANLAIMLAAVLAAARWVGVRGRALTAVGLATVLVFVLLCRTEPSVLRAAAMGLVMLAALGGTPGSGRGLRHLGAAMMALLLLDPWLARSVGFALSVLASGGIIAVSGAWRDRMTWLPRPVAEAVTVPLAAQLATQPVVTAISGEVSVVGLVANALTGPLVGPATILGFLTAALAVLSPTAASFTGWLAGWCAQGILWVAHAGAALPGASWSWPAGAAGLALVTVGSGALLVVMGSVMARRWLALACGLAMVVALSRAPMTPGWPPPDWKVVACDVGQGDAVVLKAGEGEAVLVDTGPEPRALSACLAELGVRRVPLLVLTHFHADHVGGMSAVWGRVAVGHVLVSPLESPAGTAVGLRARAAAHGAAVLTARPGQRITVGAVRWATLGPTGSLSTPRPTATTGESSAENDSSVVATADVSGLRVLLTGDAEPAAQKAVVASGADLRAHVLKVAHHGSSRQDPELVRATHARVAVIGVGADNPHGHPSAAALRLVGQAGMQVLRTDTQGSVAVGGTPERPVLTTQRRTEGKS